MAQPKQRPEPSPALAEHLPHSSAEATAAARTFMSSVVQWYDPLGAAINSRRIADALDSSPPAAETPPVATRGTHRPLLREGRPSAWVRKDATLPARAVRIPHPDRGH